MRAIQRHREGKTERERGRQRERDGGRVREREGCKERGGESYRETQREEKTTTERQTDRLTDRWTQYLGIQRKCTKLMGRVTDTHAHNKLRFSPCTGLHRVRAATGVDPEPLPEGLRHIQQPPGREALPEDRQGMRTQAGH